MQVYGIIDEAQDGRAIANLAHNFGISEQQARTVAETALPELAWALERNTLSRGGLADLMQALGQGHHEQILDTPRAWSDPRVIEDGQAILGHIMGSESKERALTARAAQASGLSGSLIEMLLPILAQMLMGAIARYAKGGLGDILSKLPIPGGSGTGDGQEKPTPRRSRDDGLPGGRGFELPRSEVPPSGGFPMPPIPPSSDDEPSRGGRGGFEMPWPVPPRRQPDPPAENPDFRTGGGLGLPRSATPPAGGYPMPPMPPSPDEARRSGRPDESGGGLPFPLPGPGDNNPYGDLSDILRRGGQSTQVGNPAGEGSLWRMVRNMLGGALGFGSRGIMGWLIQLILVRWGWRLLQRILGRTLLGR